MTITPLGLPSAPAASGITFRRYRGLEEIPGMAAANARLRRHIGLLEPIDVVAMEHRYTHLVNSDPLDDCVLAELDGRVVGYGRVEWHDLADGSRVYDMTTVVEPAAWGRGVTEALIRWSEDRLREIAAVHPTDRACWFSAYVLNGNDETRHALETMGYQAVRWDAEMLRPVLEDLEDHPLPAGYELRVPLEEELPSVFESLVAAFQEHWGEHEAADQRIESWVDDPRFRRDLVVVAWDGTLPAACVSILLDEDPDGRPRAYVDNVATHPAHRRRGLARATLVAALRRARDAGALSAYLGVDTDNPNRALSLYEACGFRIATLSASFRKAFDGGVRA